MYEGRDDYSQLMAEVAHRFDLWDTPTTTISTKQKLHAIRQKEDEGLEVFCRGLCLSVWMAFYRRTQSFCNT